MLSEQNPALGILVQYDIERQTKLKMARQLARLINDPPKPHQFQTVDPFQMDWRKTIPYSAGFEITQLYDAV